MIRPTLFPAALLSLLGGGATESLAAQQVSRSNQELSCSRPRSGGGDLDRACNLIERTLPAPSGRLEVDSRLNGGITVVGENRRDVLVRAMVEAHARSPSRAEELLERVELRVDGNRISADGPDTWRNEWWSVSFEIRVPASSDLDLRAHNGGIGVEGVTGSLRMETLNGGIRLDAVNGDVTAETTNGGITVALRGEGWQGRGLDAITTNGGVRVSVPSGYSARLETGTTNGGIDIDFPVTVQGRIGKRITTELGRGGPTIRVLTTNGRVTVTRR